MLLEDIQFLSWGFPFLVKSTFSRVCYVACWSLKTFIQLFSSYFCFLFIFVPLVVVWSVLFQVAVINLTPPVLCSIRVVVSMCQPCLQCWYSSSSFFSWRKYSSVSSLGCKALCIIIIFLFSSRFVKVLLCPTSKIVQNILRVGTADRFILFIRFLQYSFVSSRFLVLLRYSFLIFSFISTCWWCQVPISASICRFPFLQAFYFFLDLIVPFRLAHFSLKYSIPMSWLYILTTCIKICYSFDVIHVH